jgi:predicted amidophosphoribosyltransferase
VEAPSYRFRDALADLVAGARCVGCGVAAPGLCPACRARLLLLEPAATVRGVPGFPATAATGPYEGALRAVVLAAKERGALGHLPLLGDLLALAVARRLADAAEPGPLLLVPVPSSNAAVVERGLDFTGALARRAAGRLRGQQVGCRVASLVRPARALRDQAGLDRGGRLGNTAGAYRCTAAAGDRVLVVDDVVTTGATLAAVAGVLRQAGAVVLGAAVVAQTPQRIRPAPDVRTRGRQDGTPASDG